MPRHFGGRQWYFVCPRTCRSVSVLWKPPGATQFASRQFWGRQVAYASQFETPSDRALRGKAKIKARLIADLDPDEWDFPRSRSGCAGAPTSDTSRSTITTRPSSISSFGALPPVLSALDFVFDSDWLPLSSPTDFEFRNGESGGALIWNCALGRCPTVALIAAGERWRTPVEATALSPRRSWIRRPFPWPKMALGRPLALPAVPCGHPRERLRTALWRASLNATPGVHPCGCTAQGYSIAPGR